eukprot:5275405-Ditylum_brightwellii.AAC.1
MIFVRSKHNQNSSQQGSNNNLLCRYHQKHSTINLLRANEEGDKTSEKGFDRGDNRHGGA